MHDGIVRVNGTRHVCCGVYAWYVCVFGWGLGVGLLSTGVRGWLCVGRWEVVMVVVVMVVGCVGVWSGIATGFTYPIKIIHGNEMHNYDNTRLNLSHGFLIHIPSFWHSHICQNWKRSEKPQSCHIQSLALFEIAHNMNASIYNRDVLIRVLLSKDPQ